MRKFPTELDNALFGDDKLWQEFIATAPKLGLNKKVLTKISGPDDVRAVEVMPLEYWERVLDMWRKWHSAKTATL